MGGSVRSLKVWSYESCKRKLEGANPREAFDKLAEWHHGYCEGGDPMLADWSRECFGRMATVFETMVSTSATMEEFGADLEEFGCDLEEFGT